MEDVIDEWDVVIELVLMLFQIGAGAVAGVVMQRMCLMMECVTVSDLLVIVLVRKRSAWDEDRNPEHIRRHQCRSLSTAD